MEVKIIEHNLDKNYPLFLAKTTQLGHKLNTIDDIMKLYEDTIHKPLSEYLVLLPHYTLMRYNFVTFCIIGISTKSLSQLRSHAKRGTFLSTSSQYSDFSNKSEPYVLPGNLSTEGKELLTKALNAAHSNYQELIAKGINKDEAGYALPQSLSKTLLLTVNMDDLRYIFKTRLCHRNTFETQEIIKEMFRQVYAICPNYLKNCLPECANTKCDQGKMCCGNKISLEEILNGN